MNIDKIREVYDSAYTRAKKIRLRKMKDARILSQNILRTVHPGDTSVFILLLGVSKM
jgi:hypothetical protein